MKIGFLTSCLPQIGLEDIVKWALDNGFQSLELAAWPIESDRDYQARQVDADKLDEDEAKRIKDLPCPCQGYRNVTRRKMDMIMYCLLNTKIPSGKERKKK